LLAKAACQAINGLADLALSRASFAPTGFSVVRKTPGTPQVSVGASLLAKAVCQAIDVLADLALSRASPLPQGSAVLGQNIDPER
jgi:hypothetical protein